MEKMQVDQVLKQDYESVLARITLRCLSHIQAEMLSRQLDV